jgi:predicted RNase H-like HicB family nuclease
MTPEKVDYRITVHHEDNSYWAEVEQLPGCFAAGETLEEMWESLAEAIGLYLSTPQSGVSVVIGEVSATSTSESVEARVLVSS